MFIVKYMQPQGTKNDYVMTYEGADRVEEHHTASGTKIVRLTRFITGVNASENNETNVMMDCDGAQGPSAIFVENMHGRLVQRITTDAPFKALPENVA